MSRIRRSKKIDKIKIRNLVIACIIGIFLFSIYKFNFLTKSEVTPTTSVKFVEVGTKNLIEENIELFQDEQENYYIILPEKVNGFYAQKYFVEEKEVINNEENNDLSSTENTVKNPENTLVDNTVTNIENSNTITENKVDNSNTISNLQNTVQNNTNQVPQENENNVDNNEDKKEQPLSAKADSLFDLAASANNGINLLENDENKEIPTEEVPEDNNTIVDSTPENNKTENVVTENNNKDNNTETPNMPSQDNSTENTNSEQPIEKPIDNKPQESHSNIENTELPNNQEIEPKKEETEPDLNTYSAGDRIYLSKEDAKNGTYSIEVEYQTVEINNLKLYKQELKANLGEAEIKLTGFIPAGFYLNATPEDINTITELKADMEELKDSDVLLAYDIKIVNEEKEYQPKDYYQTVNVEIISAVQLAGKIDDKPVEVIHIAEDTEKDEIRFERIALAEKQTDKVEFITNEFSTYAVLAYSAIQPDYVSVYDYDSDYNYYMGKNYTDNNAGRNQNLYNSDNLAEVTINYYGYDYSKNINERRTFSITPRWSAGNSQNISNGYRRNIVTITASTQNNQIIDNKQNWQMSFTLPQAAANAFQIARTQSENSGLTISYDASSHVVTVIGNDWNNWTQANSTSYTLNLNLVFNTNVSINSVTGLQLTAVEKNLIGYVSAAENERQTLFTYVKCMPIVNGNVSFELIDNPYMDRPAGFGFDGWATHETGYNFSLNNESKVQTLTVNSNGSKKIEINLYANWKVAKVIFIDVNARNGGTGLSINSPVNNWNDADTALGTTNKAQNASDRELNILVLIGGSLDNLNTLSNKAYTLTSLYDGVDYRNNNTVLELSSRSFSLGNDLQLDYLNVTGSNSYTSTTTTNIINYCYVQGNSRNFRIGRGMKPLNSTGSRTTFTQVLGGSSTNRAYRLVIETGKYANIQLESTSSINATTNSTLVLGNDYDRVANQNDNLLVYYRTATRSGSGTITPADRNKPLFEIIVKSGSFGMDFFNTRNNDFAFSGIYLGGHSAGTDSGDRVMIVEGGNIANLIGGLAIQDDSSTVKTCIYVKGGNIQNIVGGAGVSTTRGDRTIQVTDGTVAYSVSGGSNGYTAGDSGTSNPTGQLIGDTLVYIGGNAVIGTEPTSSTLYDVNAGCVLGAGNGNNKLPETAGKVDLTHVIIDGNAYIANSVYGGGNYGLVGNEKDLNVDKNEPIIEFIDDSANIVSGENYLITNGTRIGNSVALSVNNNSNFSGRALNDTAIPISNEEWTVTKSGNGYTLRNVETGRYLGIEEQGSWIFKQTVLTTLTTPFVFEYNNGLLRSTYNSTTYYLRYNSDDWTITNRSSDGTRIYFLKYKMIEKEDEEEVPLEIRTRIDVYGGTIVNDIYGGANKNKIYGSTDINIYNGIINGTVYGGSNTSGTIYGTSNINIEGGIIGNQNDLKDILFAGGKGEDTVVAQSVKINIIDKSNNIALYGDIYGGSALGEVTSNATVTVQDIITEKNNINITGNIYGGGKGDNRTAAQNGKDVTVTVNGGNYPSAKVFGGCNINGIVSGKILVNIGEEHKTLLNEVYGGGNLAEVTTDTDSDYVFLFKNAEVEKAFNGGNSAGIAGDKDSLPRAIYAKGAKVKNLYGGSNTSGELSETFVYCSEGADIENVYGGGYGENAVITENTNVEIITLNKEEGKEDAQEEGEESGKEEKPLTTIKQNVFGGGDNGPVGKTTNVNILASKVNGTVYGGGNNAEVGENTKVIVDNSNINILFGGGNLGVVKNDTDVDILNETTAETIYGGGCSAAVNGFTNVYLENSTSNNVYGGGQGIKAIVDKDTNVELISIVEEKNEGTEETEDTDVESTPDNDFKTIINQNVYGGGDEGKVTGKTLINIIKSKVLGTVYGGGNKADIVGNTGVYLTDDTEAYSVYGGGNEGKVGTTTAVDILKSKIIDNVYGGGDKGAVTGNTTVRIDSSTVNNSIYGGGKAANVNGTQVTLQNKSTAYNIFGGGDQGEVIETTNVILDNSIVNNNLYGGGNGAETIENPGTIPGKIGLDTNVTIRNFAEIKGNAFGGGQGITALVERDTRFKIENSRVEKDIYGGGDNGSVTGSTNVTVASSIINENAYAAGNGSNAVVRGNSYISAEGETQIGKSIFGGGNAAETGPTGADTSLGIVDIAGAIIGENVYGGANSSVINGNTIVNIGIEAINRYYGTNRQYIVGKIHIGNTVFGGGESMDPSKDFDYDSISVTGTILINIDGKNYANDDINIGGSIFGSGNASSAKTNGDINIRNYGTIKEPKKGVSIQRASTVVFDNTNINLSGTTDSTSSHATTYFTLNRIKALKIKNNSTMYLRNGANLLESFYSMVGDDGKEVYAEVTINNKIYTKDGKSYDAKGDKVFDRSGNIEYYMKNGVMYSASNEKVGDVERIENLGIDRNVNNRVYMYSGINLNISPSENLESYGEVKGMSFFGIYDSNDSTESDSTVFTGMYNEDYPLGSQINWKDRDFTRCYVVGMHQTQPEQDIQKDGFYTNYEKLEQGSVVDENNYKGVSYSNYITPTPENDIYYMWYAGPDVEVYYYTFSLVASKFSTLGTKELSLLGISYPNATLKITSVDSTLNDGVGLYDKNTIPNINPDQEAANNNFGLSMKTGNNGWSLNGSTDFYSDPNGNIASFEGNDVYTIENSTTTPSLSFYLYHSNNITQKRGLGSYSIEMDLAYWIDSLNQGRAKVKIDVFLESENYKDLGYNGAITPGTQYDLFTNTETNITTDSSLSTYFELAEPNFKKDEEKEEESEEESEKNKQKELIRAYYDQSYRVINTEYVFPANTTITMIDRYDNTNPKYYYYTVTEEDERNRRVEFRFSEFLMMGSTNEYYDENEMRQKYYYEDLDYQYECFIFTVNFEGADFGTITAPDNMVTRNQHFRIFLKADIDGRPEILVGLLDDQIDSTTFGIYDTESKINIDAKLNKTKIYLGNEAKLNIDTIYDVTIVNSVRIYDTRYFDKKLGIKLTLFDKETDQVITGSSLLGTYFELNGNKYYPRTDGTTRIKIAEKVSNASSSISLNTENSTLASGKYYILVESFGSADGIYYGIQASDSDTVDMEIINNIYGLKSTIPEEQVIIDKTTGFTLDKETGYIANGKNNLNINLEYISGLTDPHITISLQRRNYDDVYDMSYNKVDLKDYINEELTLLDEENLPLEYKILDSDTINSKVTDPDVTVNFDFAYTLKSKLKSGTYKLVFTLFDENIVTKTRPVEDDSGNIIQEEYQAIEYEHIGETYSYIIIK